MRLPRLLNTSRRLRSAVAFGLLGGLTVLTTGCDVPSFIDPGELSGLRKNARQPLVVQVLDQLDPALEEGNKEFASAEAPKPEDLVVTATDYVVGPDDALQITVYDLEGPGLQTIKTTRVSGTGNVVLPYLDNVVRAEGLSEIELQQAIIEAYRAAGVLESAKVSVSVTEPRNKAYSVLGSVARPSQYLITADDFRLLDAITQAGDVNSPFLEDIYVLRHLPKAPTAPAAAPGMSPTTRPAMKGTTEPVDNLAPPQSRSNILPKQMKKSVMLQAEAPVAATQVVAEDSDPAARVGVIDGTEVVVAPGVEPASKPAAMAAPAAPGAFEFNDLQAPSDIRVIKIPLAKLRAADLRYNIVVRPRDTIIVPPGQVGFYYMHGHVLGAGAYQFSGQKVTLKQAVAAARGLDGLAIPQRTDIIRRIGPNQEMFFRVDLAGIYAGTRPDVYLKPNDVVAVGTNFLSPFLAAVRGGFRMTYGFGFLYDKNFAYDDNSQNR